MCLLEMGSLAVLTLASTGNKLLSDPGHLSLPAPRCVTWDGPTAEPSVLCLPLLTPPWCGGVGSSARMAPLFLLGLSLTSQGCSWCSVYSILPRRTLRNAGPVLGLLRGAVFWGKTATPHSVQVS